MILQMSSKVAPDKLIREDIAEAISPLIGVSKRNCLPLIRDLLEHIIQALERGEKVKLSGFGTFYVRMAAPRTARNPRTNEAVIIPARPSLCFKPSERMKAEISRRNEACAIA
jgi:integration host factor subunit alpha